MGEEPDDLCYDDFEELAGTVNDPLLLSRWVAQDLVAGTGYRVGPTGELTLKAPSVTLTDGFQVQAGGRLVVDTRLAVVRE